MQAFSSVFAAFMSAIKGLTFAEFELLREREDLSESALPEVKDRLV